jgi:uncharacterized protein YlxW (UPF0749 family)
MSLSELRKELKEARKAAMPVPVSRMKKAECAAELARIKGIHHTEVKKVEEVLESAPKKVAKKVKEVQEKAHDKAEEVVKKTKGVKSTSEVKVPMAGDKPKKGSEEMKARMAALRAKRAEKKE